MNIYVAFYYLSAILMLLVSFIPLIIYLMYGREPKISYSTNYEVDLPTDDPPAIVNAICSGFSKKVGEPDMNGFIATILDLIDRNYLILSNKTHDGKYNSPGSLFLEINPDYDPDTLWDFEVGVLNFLQEYEQNSIISMDLVSESLHYYNSADFFKETYKNWKNEVKQTLLTNGSLKEAFLRKGDKYIKIFGITGLVLSIVVSYVVLSDFWALTFTIVYLFFIYSAFLKTKDTRTIIFGIEGLIIVAWYLFEIISGSLLSVKILFLSSLVLGVISMVSLMLPEKIAGQWTNYGREYYAKWHSFKRYIEDYSLIKEYSPESVNVWNRYLVYATALGVADEVENAMKFSIPYDQLRGSDLYSFHYYNSPTAMLKNALDAALELD
jgi:uncharacterized membrane protein